MTPIYCCGFECGILDTNAPHWVASAGSPTFSTSTVRSGTRSIRCNPTAATTIVRAQGLGGSTTRHILRFYVYFASLPSANTRIAVFNAGAVSGPCVRFNQSDSKIYAAVSTTLGASGVTVTTGQWYRIDADFNVNTAGDDFCDVQVDGTACGQATATGTSSGADINELGVIDTCTADVFFDDVLKSGTAADYPIGAGKVEHYVPTSDGTHNVAGANDFEFSLTGTDITNATTTAHTLLDEIPMEIGTPVDFINLIAPPNATDYVEVKYGPAPGISAPSVAPRAVEVMVAYAGLATSPSNNIRLALVDNATTDDVRNSTANVVTVRYSRKMYATPPSGGAWNIAGSGNGAFNNLRIRCLSSDAAPDPYFVGTMIEAEFATAPKSVPGVFNFAHRPHIRYTNTRRI